MKYSSTTRLINLILFAHVGKIPELRPKERSNAKAKIDSKSAGTKAKKGEQNQVN